MNYEEKINELEERIKVLEKAENKRIRKRNIKIALEVTKILAIITIITILYININNKIIKPYKQKIDFVEEKIKDVEKTTEGISEKVNEIEKATQEMYEKIKKFFKL